MKGLDMNTAKKSVYNIFFGLLGQFVTIAVGILLPRLFIISYGSEVNGFLSSINQIFTYLSLLEMGVGAATIQALYGPIARNEHDDISGIISATNKFYRRTGRVYLVGVVILAAVYPIAVKSTISMVLQIAIILVIGCSGVVSYYFQAKYKLLLQAEGKQYILSNITTIVHVMTSVLKLALIAAGFSVIWLQVSQLCLTIAQTVFYSYYIKKNYKWLDISTKPNNVAISQKNSVMLHEISWMVFNHTDVLLLTLLLQDLKIVSVYVLYNSFVEMVATMIQNVNNGFIYRLGQLYNSDRSSHDRLFNCYESYYMAFSFAAYCVTFMFLMPFMKLYTAGITDTNYLLTYMPLLFVVYKTIVSGRSACGSLITYAGHFKQTRWHAVLEAAINLGLSILCIVFFEKNYGLGVYGTLIGTICALIFRANVMIVYANRRILNRPVAITYLKFIVNAFTMLTLCYLFIKLKISINSYFILIGLALVMAVLVLLIFVIINSLENKDGYRVLKKYLTKISKHRKA